MDSSFFVVSVGCPTHGGFMKHHHHHHHQFHATHRDHGDHKGPGGRHSRGDGFTRGRKFSSDDLQLMLLALLADSPGHGYQLIKALDERSDGVYSPSPGMVYPALTYMQELGLVEVASDGNKKSYSLAPDGQARLDSQRARTDELFAGLGHMARKMHHLRGALAEESAPEGSEAWLPEFVDARRSFKRALLTRSNASQDEQRRIAAILQKAIAEIEGGTAVGGAADSVPA
jgi:DNA-binding PadR family transcriptional regulator